VDIGDAAEALTLLFGDAALRRRMGEAAQARARSIFDWRVVIPQYQALWAELERRRRAAPPQPPRLAGDNPWRLDPFRMFAAYPTAALASEDVVWLARAFAEGEAAELMGRASVRYAAGRLPTEAEALALLEALAAGPLPVSTLLAPVAPERRAIVERGLVWLAKYGFLRLRPAPIRT
jgi:glycosyltransferase involved in cell wall biosynthesis